MINATFNKLSPSIWMTFQMEVPNFLLHESRRRDDIHLMGGHDRVYYEHITVLPREHIFIPLPYLHQTIVFVSS